MSRTGKKKGKEIYSLAPERGRGFFVKQEEKKRKEGNGSFTLC